MSNLQRHEKTEMGILSYCRICLDPQWLSWALALKQAHWGPKLGAGRFFAER
jgi:hypothetical protein